MQGIPCSRATVQACDSARLVRIADLPDRRRPKVGELRGAPFQIPDEAFAPLTDNELKEWGL